VDEETKRSTASDISGWSVDSDLWTVFDLAFFSLYGSFGGREGEFGHEEPAESFVLLVELFNIKTP
jgi:hypothetical protein